MRLDYGTILIKEMKTKTVLKFDTGADGFQKMIYVLVFMAAVVLAAGIYFIVANFGGNHL